MILITMGLNVVGLEVRDGDCVGSGAGQLRTICTDGDRRIGGGLQFETVGAVAANDDVTQFRYRLL